MLNYSLRANKIYNNTKRVNFKYVNDKYWKFLMNLKEEIGRRILAARKGKGLTRKALADLTDDLKQSRINNWERGERTPGPEEIKQLAKVLDVSAAYLMCLTNQQQTDPLKSIPGLGALIPLLDAKQASDPIATTTAIKNMLDHKDVMFIPLGTEVSEQLGKYAFALKMQDDSMVPELKLNDVLIIDPDKKPHPGQFAVARVGENSDVIVRRYKQLSASTDNQQFELLAENKHWADVKDSTQCQLVGTVCGLIRALE